MVLFAIIFSNVVGENGTEVVVVLGVVVVVVIGGGGGGGISSIS